MTALIVGLGNPGSRFDGTRHNIGFAAVDKLAQYYRAEWKAKPAWVADVAMLPNDVILIKPQTFMNDSGRAVRAVAQFYKIRPTDVCLVYDERDLPFAGVRWLKGIRTGAHHNGVRSVASDFSRDIARLRLGIGNELMGHRPLDEFVLDKFTAEERQEMDDFLNRACTELAKRYELPAPPTS